jgi:hypothetical protein
MAFKPMTFGAPMGCQPVGVSAFQQSSAADEAEAAKREATPKVCGWVEQMLPEEERSVDLGGKAPSGKATNVMVTQLACKEDDCPDIETAITLMRPKPREKLLFKIYKPAAEMTREEVEEALQKSVAEELLGTSDAAGGDAGHAGDCCDADEHGHDEHEHEAEAEAAAGDGAAADSS